MLPHAAVAAAAAAAVVTGYLPSPPKITATDIFPLVRKLGLVLGIIELLAVYGYCWGYWG